MAALEAKTPAPHFELKDSQGNSHSLADALKQGPVLLAFYKDSCPVCQYAFPFIERIQKGLKGLDGSKAQIWGISQDSPADTTAFADEYGCTFTMLSDTEGFPVSNDYGITSVPSTFLIEQDGTISESAVGFDRGTLESAAERFGKLSGTTINVVEPGEQVPDYKPG